MIFLFKENPRISDELLEVMTAGLPDARRAQAARFRFRDGKISCAAAYLVFLYGFVTLYGQKSRPDFSVSENGKPYLADFPDIHFNLSHCKDAVCCIFGDSPVGIDIQEARRLNISSVKKICSAKESDLIMHSADPSLEFCRIWTVKEALSKLSGNGIFRDVRALSAESENAALKTFFFEPNIYMSAASCSSGADFAVRELHTEELLRL